MRRHVLVTRPADQAEELCSLLRERSIFAVAVPTVEIDRESAASELDATLGALGDAAWMVITSANGARALADRLAASDRSLPPELRVAAVGPATAHALRDAGIRVDHVPDAYLTVAIAEGLGEVEGRRVVLARADAATPDLRDALLARGARVTEVVAYRTVEGPAASRDQLRAALHRDLDGIAFSASSTVRGLIRLASGVDRGRARTVPCFCIGPVTAATATRMGFHVAAVATEHTAAGLADAIHQHFTGEDR